MADYDIDEIKTNLKATITSNKGGVDISMVERDYLNIVGEPLPYYKLGFKNIIDFIKSLGTFNLEKRGSSIIVHCVSSAKTQHLDKMIQRQKSVKKKPKRKKPSSYYGSNNMSKLSNYYKPCYSKQNFPAKKPPYSSYNQKPSYNNYAKTSTYNSYVKPTTYSSNNVTTSSCSNIARTQSYNSSASTSTSNLYNRKPVSNSATTQYNMKSANIPKTNSTNNVSKTIAIVTQSSFDQKPNVVNNNIKKDMIDFAPTNNMENNKPVKINGAINCDNLAVKNKKPGVGTIKAVENGFVTPIKASTLLTNSLLKPQSAQSRLDKFVKKQMEISKKNCNLNDSALKENDGCNTFDYSTTPLLKMLNSTKNFVDKIAKLEIMMQCHCNTSAACTKLKFDDESCISKPVKIDRSKLFEKHETSENNESNGVYKPKDENVYYESIIPQQTFQNKQIGTIKAVYNYCSIFIVLDDTCTKEKYLSMHRNLNTYMLSNYSKKVMTSLKENQYYALYDLIEWHRIIVKKFLINGKVEVLKIDTGESKCVHKEQIYHLDAKFYKIEAQAIEFSLGKFKLISEFQFFKEILVQSLVDKKCIISPGSVKSSPPVVNIFDAENMANMCDVIINKFVEICTPNLSSSVEGSIIEAKVMSIVDGFWYIQLKDSVLLSYFEKLFLKDEFSSPCLKNIRDVNYKNVYLTNLNDKIKGRVKVLHLVDDNNVKVFFIDYGKQKIVNSKDLIEVNKIEPLLARLPHQAMKIVLQLFPPNYVNDKTIQLFYQIVGETEEPVVGLLNVTFHEKYKVPCAQFCSKLYPNTILNMVLYKRLQDSKK